MNRMKRSLVCLVVALGAVAFASAGMAAKPENKGHENAAMKHQDKQQAKAEGKQHGKGHHHNGKDLVGAKIKTNGHHVIENKGDVETSVDVKDGKIAGLHAKHAKKGELAVTKYKTTKRMAQAESIGGEPRMVTVQDQYVGTVYIGYSYVNDYGEEDIYWFPYDMILDGDTGAIEYVESA